MQPKAAWSRGSDVKLSGIISVHKYIEILGDSTQFGRSGPAGRSGTAHRYPEIASEYFLKCMERLTSIGKIADTMFPA
jgi:hypothetical protein